ncbi:ABC transporter ATP-binding protein/permease (plasmid) [Streptomyces sp. NBC_01527]|uniref:ABC transporter ATP-binding protein n=1 Tax=Streptomyces sp. NBC_01527 TaxID=2903894 RepID=UPI002F910478
MRDKSRFCLSLCLVVLSVAVSMVSTVLLKEIVDVALPERDVPLLGLLCSVMVLANVSSGVLTIILARLNHTRGQALVHTLRIEVFGATQRMPLGHFTANSTSEVQTRIASDIGGVANVLTFAAQGLLASATALVTSTVIMFLMSWQLALLSLTLAFSLNLLNNRYAKKRRQLAHSQQSRVADMMRFVGEHLSLSGVLLGRTMKREDWQFARFDELSKKTSEETARQNLAGRTALAVISMTLSLLPVFAYWAAGTVLTGVSLGSVVVITALQVQISMPIQQLLQLSSEIQAAGALFERIFATIDSAPPRAREQRAIRDPMNVAPTEIRLDEVTFNHQGSEHPTLTSLSLRIPVGSRTFIVGESGSGKTTLALLLAGLVKPDSGTVSAALADGAVARDMATLVTLVPQESVLFNLSIRENLAFGDPSRTSDDMVNALETVELTRLVSRLPQGLDTAVGERGAQMSGGERQRLAVARSLLTRAPVMVLDEFSSGIDKETSEAIFDSLLQKIDDRILIFVTHRLPPLREGDTVVTMSEGTVLSVRNWHGDSLGSASRVSGAPSTQLGVVTLTDGVG